MAAFMPSLSKRLANARRRGLRSLLLQSGRALRSIETLSYQYPKAQAWKEGDLRFFEAAVYSQNGEDGIIKEMLRRLGIQKGTFLEIGAESGIECNCARLAREEGWRGFFVEGDPAAFKMLRENYRTMPGVTAINAWVTASNVEQLLASHDVPQDLEFLSLDIDGNDYWVYQAMDQWRPSILVMEYNASLPPPQLWVMQRNDGHCWDGTTYFGASLTSLTKLAETKGYKLVGTDSMGANAFFVRSDVGANGLFLDETLAYLYSPPRYGFFGKGHRRKTGPHEEI
jgi:hypothetical protein